MKKTVKTLSALTLALALVCSTCTAFAASTPADGSEAAAPAADSTASVTVTTANANDALSAYRVVNAAFDPDANTLTYSFTDLFENFQASEMGAAYENMTVEAYCDLEDNSSALEALLGAFSAYIRSEEPPVQANYTETTNGSGAAAFQEVAMGQYIILGSGNSQGAYVYQTVTAEVVPEIVDDEYVLYPAYSVAMKTALPTAEKAVTNLVQDGQGWTASIGDVINYELTATIPTYSAGATNTTFYMYDALADGLTLEADSVAVKGFTGPEDTEGAVLTAGEDYFVTTEGQVLTIRFVYDKIKSYTSLTAAYSAELDNDAAIGEAAEGGHKNENTYTLVYSNDPFNGSTKAEATDPAEVEGGYGKDENTVDVFTYGLVIEKYKDGEPSTKLKGATFEIYKAADVADGKVNADAEPVETITTDKDGYAAFAGLAKGKYYLKETVAPTGYKLMPDLASFTIGTPNEDNGAGYAKVTSEGDKITVAEGTAVDGYWKVDIANTPGATLPTTGGMGTVVFTGVGATLMLGAAVLLITKKRLTNKEK